MEEKAKEESIKDKIGTGIGWVIGGAIGYYTGLNFLIPFGLALLSGWIANKIIKSSFSKAMIPAFAVQCGQMLWMFLAILWGYPASIIIELILVIIVLVWLLMRPSLIPVILLSIYQIIGFVDSILKFISYSFGTPEHKALLIHLIIRIVAVFLMFTGLREIRKHKVLDKTQIL